MMIGWKQVSDDEYVEQVRKQDRTIRRMWWLWPVLLFGMLYGLIRVAGFVKAITADFSHKEMIYAGLLFGVTFGLMISMIAIQSGMCIKQWIDARKGFRTERLMLKYHDELKQKETPNAGPSDCDRSP